MRKFFLCLAISLLATCVWADKASAYPVQVAWLLKAYGSTQIIMDANHVWGEGYDQWGNYQGRMFDQWLDLNCQIVGITGGNNWGTPLRIQYAAPFGWDVGCIPGIHQSQYYGWSNGQGGYSGQNFYHGGYVRVYESYVFPRSGANSRGTTLEIY